MLPSAQIYINKYSTDKNGKNPVSIKVTFLRSRRYYSTGVSVGKEKKRNPNWHLVEKLHAKAIAIINKLQEGFTFNDFKKLYYKDVVMHTSGSIEEAFHDYISTLNESKIKTIESYQCALNCFLRYKKHIHVTEITPNWLNNFSAWAEEKGISKTTIGIYTRSLRSVINYLIAEGKLPKEMYPFGRKKYSPPAGKKNKRALAIDEIKRIFDFQPESNSQAMHRDLWLFLYLCNGMNVADMCNLKWSNIKDGKIKFVRQKTSATKSDTEEITVILLPQALEIIEKWGDKKSNYVFGIFSEKTDHTQMRKRIYNCYRRINKHMKAIANKIGIEKQVTTYYARHSFATILRNSGTSIEMISEMLGHSDVKITRSYLSTFEEDKVRKATQKLVDF